ncbi:MAG: hypothetical protein ACKOES_03165 [Planctomycetaceae bacterium]
MNFILTAIKNSEETDMGYFDGLGAWNNSTGVQPTSSNTTNGNSAKWQNGNSFSMQIGNSVTSSSGNSDSIRTGYSNSLVQGFNFSTTLGFSFSTIVGTNVPSTGGGKIEHITPWSLKQVLGAWDVDIKWAIQNKVNRGRVYDFNITNTYESKTGKNYKLKPSGDVDFASKMEKYVGTQVNVIKTLRETIAENKNQLGLRIEEVAVSDTKTVTGKHSITAGSHAITSTGGAAINMMAWMTLQASLIRLVGEQVNIG